VYQNGSTTVFINNSPCPAFKQNLTEYELLLKGFNRKAGLADITVSRLVLFNNDSKYSRELEELHIKQDISIDTTSEEEYSIVNESTPLETDF